MKKIVKIHEYATNMYPLCSCSECKTCCYFNDETGICHIGINSKRVQEFRRFMEQVLGNEAFFCKKYNMPWRLYDETSKLFNEETKRIIKEEVKKNNE